MLYSPNSSDPDGTQEHRYSRELHLLSGDGVRGAQEARKDEKYTAGDAAIITRYKKH